jgi:hypothetical protein
MGSEWVVCDAYDGRLRAIPRSLTPDSGTVSNTWRYALRSQHLRIMLAP